MSTKTNTEIALIGMGLFALVPVSIALILGGMIWEAWWLYPMWAWLVVPLGVPALSFWSFAALDVFLSTMLIAVPPTDYAKDKESKYAWVAEASNRLLRPVIAFYVVRWMIF